MGPLLSIAKEGDDYERRYWALFAKDLLPSYEVFWSTEIAPLTNRAKVKPDVLFQSKAELTALGKTDEDVANAQLHYTALLHLGRVFDLLAKGDVFDRWDFAESFVRLTGANDVADELLQRRSSPGVYEAWSERAGENARRAWRQTSGDPLKDIRDYRNRLVHGRMVPELRVTITGGNQPPETILTFPRIEKANAHLDWRRALDPATQRASLKDFGDARAIVDSAWRRVVDYAESAWKTYLLASIAST